MVICACDKAHKGCDKVCLKGVAIKPTRVYYAPWPYKGPAFPMKKR